MNNNIVVLFSFSILIAAIAGLLKIKTTDGSFYPFILCLCIASINEIISMVMSRMGHSTNINNNIYVLAEACLLTWQFKNWEAFQWHKRSFSLVILLVCILWGLEYNTVFKLQHIGQGFRVIYSFLLVLLSIYLNSKLIFSYQGKIFVNPVFLICTGFIIYFTFKILVEVLWMYGLTVSKEFSAALFVIIIWVNFFVNIIYFIAIICIPKKKFYIRPC